MSGRLGKLVGGSVLAAAILVSVLGPPDWLSLPAVSDGNYDYHEQWQRHLAPKERCPGGDDPEAPLAEQEQTMLCLINWARGAQGLMLLARSPLLMRSARLKSETLVRCDEFTHTPCGNPAELEARTLGYLSAGGSVGENLAFGGGEAGAPRPTLDGWLASPGHRATIFRADWREQGIAAREASDFASAGDVLVWVSHFGAPGSPFP